ncbi:amidohydrolase [Kitasatospora aureofaciens]|uniref:amidohydrolase family protein n=1 Tax=Kitasatospora aureofaciens TaxID=1894 RepID=UPI001C48A04C|nr:amidohydrolase family protein [Kitasatospora aureofaciens]MBV6702505.1 amidohydrolase family protein [Kitasatospora aureofaciens]
MRVDAHHHVWELGRRPQDWLDGPETAPLRRDFTTADLTPRARAAGVDRTVLVQVLPDPAETREFLALAAAEPMIAGVVGWVDLTAPGVADTLADLRHGPGGGHLVGARHLVQGEADPAWLARPDVRRGLRAVGAAGLCYDLLVLPHQLPAAVETARALPDQRFVLDHLAKPPIARGGLDPWAALLRELAAEPNVFCKLSGLVTEARRDAWSVAELRPYADTALDAFGPGRTMFGSDWPVCLLAASYEEVVGAAEELTAGLDPQERAQVFGGTAARAYGLSEPAPQSPREEPP